MEMVHKLEKQLGDVFKDLPSLPENARELLVKVWPYLALIGGVVRLLAAWGLWQVFSVSDQLVSRIDGLDYFNRRVSYNGFDKTLIFIGIAVLAIEAIILLMAYAPLAKRAKKGWDLLFIVALINVVYAIVQIFMRGSGLGDAIGSIIGSAIGFYLLFQIRSKYGVSTHAKAHPSAHKPKA